VAQPGPDVEGPGVSVARAPRLYIGSFAVRGAYLRSAFTSGLSDPSGHAPTVSRPDSGGIQVHWLAHLLPQLAMGLDLGLYQSGALHAGGAARAVPPCPALPSYSLEPPLTR
jgi:hypothetical protein